MSRGSSEISDLKLEKLQRLIETFMTPPNLVLMGLFGGQNAESDTIKWESMIGNRGMTPFVPPGQPAPQTSPVGVKKAQATAAFWKEKIHYDEAFLNNLREPGTPQAYQTAQRQLARDMFMLRNRCDRRKEWMFAQMLTSGQIYYLNNQGTVFTVDYGIPSDQMASLAASRYWGKDGGVNQNAVEDIFDARLAVQNRLGARLDYAMLTTEVLKLLLFSPHIQALLAKSAFGDGDLFARPIPVLSALLDFDNFIVYDEQYVAKAWLTANVTADSTTTIYVDDSTDFFIDDGASSFDTAQGAKLKFINNADDTWEEETISAVDISAGTITVSTAPSTSYKAGRDSVTLTKKFLPTNKFCMFASQVEGQPIAEFMNAPFSIPRTWGMKVDSHEDWDPEVTWIRVQNKGLPVLYHRDAMYTLTVTG